MRKLSQGILTKDHKFVASRICAVILCVLVWTGCGGSVASPRKAAAEIEGTLNTGINYLDFTNKLQSLGGAIAVAKREGASANELRPYTEAFEMYMDSQALWKMKIECPQNFSPGKDASACGPMHIVVENVASLAAKYGVPYDNKAIAAWRAEIESQSRLRRSGSLDLLPSYPNAQMQIANWDVFDKLLQAIWKKAAKITAEG